MDFFIAMPEVVNVIAHGDTKSSVKLKSGINVDLACRAGRFVRRGAQLFHRIEGS